MAAGWGTPRKPAPVVDGPPVLQDHGIEITEKGNLAGQNRGYAGFTCRVPGCLSGTVQISPPSQLDAVLDVILAGHCSHS